MVSRLLRIVALVSVLACGGDDGGPEQTLTGTWRGPVLTGQLSLTLTQTGRDIAGNGTLVATSASAALTAAGTATLPTFSITLTAPGFEAMNFSGSLGTNTLTGTLNGSGFVQTAVTLTKQ